MMDYNNRVIKQQILLDNFQDNKYHHDFKENDYLSLRNNSPYCIDDLTIGIKIEKELISNVVFKGEGCTIAVAATNIICKNIHNKTIKEAIAFLTNFSDLLINKKDVNHHILNEAMIFNDTHLHANRIKCAEIGLHTFNKIIKRRENNGK